MGTTATVTATSGGLGILKPGLSAQTTGIVTTSSSLSGLKLANTTLTPSVSTTQLGGLGLGGGGLKLSTTGLGTGMSQGGLTLQGGRGATGLTTMAQSTAVTSSSASGFRGLGGVDPSASAGNNGGIGG